jgi:hypothetical protein
MNKFLTAGIVRRSDEEKFRFDINAIKCLRCTTACTVVTLIGCFLARISRYIFNYVLTG